MCGRRKDLRERKGRSKDQGLVVKEIQRDLHGERRTRRESKAVRRKGRWSMWIKKKTETGEKEEQGEGGERRTEGKMDRDEE